MNRKFKDYVLATNWLTKQERRVIQITLALLLMGWAVKTYRTAHPTNAPEKVEQAKN